MKKKFLALVLTLAMVLSLVPATALAMDGTDGGASQKVTRDNLTMTKTVTPNEDGTYTVRLESYATGSVTTTQTPVPMDIVLVLDVSGSMDEEIASYTYQATRKTSWSVKDVYNDYYDWGWRTDVTYYAKVDDEYYPVFYKEKWVSQGWFKGYSEYWLEANNQVLGHKVTDSTWEETVYDQELYTRQTDPNKTTKKLDAMKTAVNNFIESVAAQKNGDDSVAHRISIVKFAGKSKNEIGNHTYTEYGDTYNYTQEVKELTDVTAEGSVASLKNAVNALNAGGATAADWGMQKAKDVLTKREKTENPSIVIMFTDGEPNHGNGYGASVAGNTVQAAKGLKDGGTKVYTIGMFKDLQPSNADKVDTYMNGVSSNYPEAVKADDVYNDSGVTLGNRAEGNYYFKADNAGALDQVFQKISQSTTTTSPLDDKAVVVDNVPSNFALTEGSVKVYTAECTGKNGGEFTWGADTPAQGISSTSTKNQDGSQTISTTGFKFSENWCGVDGDTHRGQKLIIKFTISRTNYGGTQPTNAGAYIKAKEADEKPIISLADPQVPVTVQLPNVNNPAVRTKTYDGAGFDIKDEIGKIIDGLVPVDGTKNEFIDLTYEIKDSSGKPVGTYAIRAGQTNGTWSTDSTEITTSPNVGEYKYTITVTGQDKNEKQPNNKDSKECTATFTITKKEEVSYTVIFDANGGAWDNGDKTVPQTYESSSSLVSRPTNDPTKSGSTFVDWAYKDAEGTFHSIGQNPFMGIRVSMLQQLSGVTGNSVTLYAVWKDNDTAPTGSLNYRINQYFIDETGEVANSISKPGRNTVDTAISTLISDLIPQDRSFPNYQYKEAKTTVNNEKYNGNEKLAQDDTVINLYYYLDNWKDADTTSGEDTDSETGGDGIPDCQQVKIQYLVYKENGGTVSRKVEIATFDNDTLNAIHGSTAKANSGFTFVTWSGRDVAVNDITVDNVIATTEPKSGPDFKPSPTELVKGNAYTYTAIFLEDKIGVRNDDGTDKGDEIPDRYQVTINYVDDNTGRGKITGLTKEVKTIYVNGKEGKWASKGKVVASGSTATATGSRCYFSRWTNDAKVDTSKAGAALGQQTIENAEGGKTYTFTANFGRSSGGHSGGGTVTIPDDVPTGLNGKDHYAYVVGYPDGMVYPQKNITRAEVATIFFRLLEDETREANMTKSNSYNDMKDGAWYTCAVSTLSKMGIIKGYEDGSFKPDASISRAEFAAIAARFDPDGDKTPATFSDVSSHWAKDEISIAANHGWIKGYEDGSFKPDQKITRAETMTLVNRVLKRLPETKDDLHKDMKTWPDNQNESAWFYLAVQEATNSHYQKLKKDGTHETWESMRETRDWAALEK